MDCNGAGHFSNSVLPLSNTDELACFHASRQESMAREGMGSMHICVPHGSADA